GGRYWGELPGATYFEARDRRELPVVGDWVMIAPTEGAQARGAAADGAPARPEQLAIIHEVLPRRSCLVRGAAGEKVAPQPIAANVDVAFIVTSANLDLNPRRLERYLAMARGGGAGVVIAVNKMDLVDDAAPVLAAAASAAPGLPVVALSATRGDGVDALLGHLGPGRTGVLLGSSGVGKSTVLNALLGRDVQEVQPVRADDDRGRHTTTRRELFVLDAGVLIDTPGMRELKTWVDDDDEPDAFDDVAALAARCRFADCRHQQEPGCEVRAAAERGELAADRLAGYRKLQLEQAADSRRRDEAARLDERRRGKVGARALRARLKDKGRTES
ncbi:MAG: ribosome small subunit-dependent GTPase A, partial [Kofleriaceae bacterium]|nr:ribosome small subunit-dependent GTPase A [Kofleriaceae bacterium]